MDTERSQKFIARDRNPRVQVEYNVAVHGTGNSVQLPFVIGEMAERPGQPDAPPPATDMAFPGIDVDRFDERLKAGKPRVAVQLPASLAGEGMRSVEITFERMDEFSRGAIPCGIRARRIA